MSQSFAQSVGAFIGKTGAYAGHVACVTATATGRAGADLVSGVADGYVTKAAELSERRAAARAQLQAEFKKLPTAKKSAAA